jgi:dienelactone hydrolase
MGFSDQAVELPGGLVGDIVEIPTANPASFHQVISDPGSVPAARIFGQLFLPVAQGRVPVVVVVPGSMGVAPSHILKAELLTAAGIGACVIDPFGERNVTSTVANQAQYSFAASAWDVLAAAACLAARADIDAARIGAQGHSRGGSAILAAACLTRFEIPGLATALCGAYAAYPWCGHQFLNPDVGSTVVRAVVGERDDWTLPQQVQGQIHAMRLCGADASCRIFAEAHHSFDRDTPVELIEEASVSPSAPTAYLNDEGMFIHPLAEEADPDITERELMLYSVKSGHGRRGAHIGTRDDQSDLFHDDMMAFWRSVMNRSYPEVAP